ncbi:MAG: hypothetical protein JWL73_2690 [Actinomycetia bacterium]|nr:hypothetical protein [Actinomycetes bacterium]
MTTEVAAVDDAGPATSRRERRRGALPERSFTVGLAVVAGLGLLVRWAYIWRIGRKIPIGGDAGAYFYLGRNLANGLGYIRPYDYELSHHVRVVPTAEFPPLFPGWLALLHLVGIDSFSVEKYATAVLGAVLVVLIGFLGRKVAGRAVGLVAALLAAAYPLFIASDGGLTAETLYGVLIVGFLLAFLAALDRPAVWRWVVVGLIVGFAALTRSEALALVVFVVVPIVLARRKALAGGWGGALRMIGVTVLATLVVVTPWLIRDRVVMKGFVPISNNSGTMLAGANCHEAYYTFHLGHWLFRCVMADTVLGFNEMQQAKHFRKDGLDYARAHKGRVPYVAAVRVMRTYGVWDFRDEINLESFESRNHSWLTGGHWFYFAMIPFSVAGMVLGFRRRRRYLWPLASTLIMVAVVSALSYGNQRFRLAAEPAIIVFAAVAVVRLLAFRWPRLWDRAADDPPPSSEREAGPVREQEPESVA